MDSVVSLFKAVIAKQNAEDSEIAAPAGDPATRHWPHAPVSSASEQDLRKLSCPEAALLNLFGAAVEDYYLGDYQSALARFRALGLLRASWRHISRTIDRSAEDHPAAATMTCAMFSRTVSFATHVSGIYEGGAYYQMAMEMPSTSSQQRDYLRAGLQRVRNREGSEAMALQAKILFALRHYADVLTTLQEDTSITGTLWKVRAQIHLDQVDRALPELNRVLEVRPRNVETPLLLDTVLEAAQTLVDQKRGDDALVILRNAYVRRKMGKFHDVARHHAADRIVNTILCNGKHLAEAQAEMLSAEDADDGHDDDFSDFKKCWEDAASAH